MIIIQIGSNAVVNLAFKCECTFVDLNEVLQKNEISKILVHLLLVHFVSGDFRITFVKQFSIIYWGDTTNLISLPVSILLWF